MRCYTSLIAAEECIVTRENPGLEFSHCFSEGSGGEVSQMQLCGFLTSYVYLKSTYLVRGTTSASLLQMTLPSHCRRGAVCSQVFFLPLLPALTETSNKQNNIWFQRLKPSFCKAELFLLLLCVCSAESKKIKTAKGFVLNLHLSLSWPVSLSFVHQVTCFLAIMKMAANCCSLLLTRNICQHIKNTVILHSAYLSICKAFKFAVIQGWSCCRPLAHLDAGYSASGPHCSPVPLEDE